MATKVVIIGGGFGGISVAKQLSSSEFEVTLIDKTNHHLFQPLLYQVATAALSPGDIAIPIRAIFSKRKNLNVILGEVTDIQKDAQQVQLKDGELIPFDYLILAPGSQYNYFGNDDWKSHAPGLKSLGDALQIRERILLSLEKAERLKDASKRAPYLTYVIIGGGPTGVETAGSIAEIAKRNMMRDFKNIKKDETRIVLVEAAQNVLNGYPDELSDVAKNDLEKMGVQVLLNTPVKDITDEGVQLEDQFIETPNVIWAAGTAASPLLQCLGEDLDKAGRVKVQADLSISDNPNIFVIGDAAYFEDKDNNPLPGVAPVALQQGKYVGELINDEQKGKARSNFKYLDKGMMATIGRAKAIANIRGIKVSGFIAWLMWGFIHIFFLIGFRNRFRVFAEWIWHYLTFKRGVRLITERKKED
ncbi:NAD(P)/FAD-dependent oxidoreductase [Balneola vulgaris]|uniref:NAD(P)/FAD-dependent oxidoreductase n=1 Tax=Balneola vulgaris TaxID=287535 RepID=UPI00035F75FD|nr:NAD(P)/FAD-dependent oxidoreductase [Balneola vulgaris]